MTQMLLFDAPADLSLPVAARPAPASEPRSQSPNRSASLFDPASDDIKHMGDLAKLVLLRYELLYQRRAARRQRQSRSH